MGLYKRKELVPVPLHPIDVKPCPVCGINAVGLNDVNCIKCFLALAIRVLLYTLMAVMAILFLLWYLEPVIETPISCYPNDWMGPIGPLGLSRGG